MAHRAREHVQSRRKRFEPVDPQRVRPRSPPQFFAAAATGDVDGLMAMLAPDVVWTADSDGKVSAARRPVLGRRQGGQAGHRPDAPGRPGVGRVEPAIYNNAPALVLYLGDRLEGVITVEVIDGKITNFYAMRNPEKLTVGHGPAGDQPLALLPRSDASRCGSSGSATGQRPRRCCAPSPTPRPRRRGLAATRRR